MADNKNKPHIEYRVELEKRIEINKSFSERRNQAVAMRILSYGLFGQKRYQNLYLSCSLNCFHLALKIASQIHQRVPGLAMIIKFETVQVLEYFSEQFEGRYFDEKKYSKILIKLTRNPTDEDKKEPGFNPGLSADEVQEPLTEVLKRRSKPETKEHYKAQNSQHSQHKNPREKEQGNKRDNKAPHHQPYHKEISQAYKPKYREAQHERVDEYQRGDKKTRGGHANSTTNVSRSHNDNTRRGGAVNKSDNQTNKRSENNRSNIKDDNNRRNDRRPKRSRYDDDDN